MTIIICLVCQGLPHKYSYCSPWGPIISLFALHSHTTTIFTEPGWQKDAYRISLELYHPLVMWALRTCLAVISIKAKRTDTPVAINHILTGASIKTVGTQLQTLVDVDLAVASLESWRTGASVTVPGGRTGGVSMARGGLAMVAVQLA